MPLSKNYDASQYESNLYQEWLNTGAFTPTGDKEPFTIIMPPPNATGKLHLGHAIMLAIQDTVVRHKRMQGYDTLWLPGTDHASIATQTRVEKNLLKEGITKDSLGREKFLQEIDEFVSNSKNEIREQVTKMGSSCDWTREKFTLDEDTSHVVSTMFCKMYDDGLIYRGHRIINWDPVSQTALADDEVEHKETTAKLYYIKYGPLEVATSRPETKLGDTAVAVHPDDSRYKAFIGQTLDIKFGDHKIQVVVIADEAIDPEYGTGAVGVTPAHSFTDYELAQKHKVNVVQVIDQKGLMTEAAGKYKGLTVLEAREAFVKDLEDLGLLIKTEEYTQNLSISYRSGAIIEPLISEQWFVDVNKPAVDWEGKKLSLKEVSQKVVREKQIEFIPDRFSKLYFHWVDNLHDWCISRQIWYGHRIPAWYHKETNELKVQINSPGEDWEQDPDTLDTWFSSGMWTFSTLGWPNNTADFQKFHPTDLLETGYDIIPFWVARMILMTTYATKQIPFKKVYLHGLIRDKQGRKMSKSLGNGIDPLDMIEKYGTDALRLSLILHNSPGNDLKIYEEKIATYRNFITKLWNATRFTLSKLDTPKIIDNIDEILQSNLSLPDQWILSRLQQVIQDSTQLLKEYRLSDAGILLHDFVWNEFCDWYLEFSKEHLNQSVLNYVLQSILTLLHPFTPFVTEQIWKSLQPNNMLLVSDWPKVNSELQFSEAQSDMQTLIDLITHIRAEKAKFGVAAKTDIQVCILTQKHSELLETNKNLIQKLGKVVIHEVSNDIEKTYPQASLKVQDSNLKFYTLLEGQIDFDVEKEKTNNEIQATTEQIKHLKGRLSNESYVKNAPPELVEETKNNLTELETKLEELQDRLKVLTI